jgi:ribosomal subunit interface protein
MTLTITGRHCTVAEDVRDRVNERIEAFTRIEPRIDSATVTFEVDHGVKRAEARLCVAGAQTMVAHGTGDSFPSAFDAAFDRLDRQLRRRVEQRRSHHSQKSSELTPSG